MKITNDLNARKVVEIAQIVACIYFPTVGWLAHQVYHQTGELPCGGSFYVEACCYRLGVHWESLFHILDLI